MKLLKKLLRMRNKRVYLSWFIVYIIPMGNIGWTGIIIIAILVVILFGKGKISSIMGDLAKGIKSFKKGMSDDNSSRTDDPNNNSDNPNSDNK